MSIEYMYAPIPIQLHNTSINHTFGNTIQNFSKYNKMPVKAGYPEKWEYSSNIYIKHCESPKSESSNINACARLTYYKISYLYREKRGIKGEREWKWKGKCRGRKCRQAHHRRHAFKRTRQALTKLYIPNQLPIKRGFGFYQNTGKHSLQLQEKKA